MPTCEARINGELFKKAVFDCNESGYLPQTFIYKKVPVSKLNYSYNSLQILGHFLGSQSEEFLLWIEDDVRLSKEFPTIIEIAASRHYYAFAPYVNGFALYSAGLRKALEKHPERVEPDFYEIQKTSGYYGSVCLLLSRQCARDMLALNWRLEHGNKSLQVDNALKKVSIARRAKIITYLPNPVAHTGAKSTMTTKSGLQSAFVAPDLRGF